MSKRLHWTLLLQKTIALLQAPKRRKKQRNMSNPCKWLRISGSWTKCPRNWNLNDNSCDCENQQTLAQSSSKKMLKKLWYKKLEPNYLQSWKGPAQHIVILFTIIFCVFCSMLLLRCVCDLCNCLWTVFCFACDCLYLCCIFLELTVSL